MTQAAQKRVGVYDSGVGGLTVLGELLEQHPQHHYFYYGDTANVPYGSKSVEQIQCLAVESAAYFKDKRLDLLIVACNTVSCTAIPEIEAALPGVPVIGVVEAGVTSIITNIHDKKNVLILGTQTTIHSKVYSQLIKGHRPSLQVHEQACPLLVPMIEGGWNDHPVLKLVLKEYTETYLRLEPGVALLACTHYPWIKKQFELALPNWKILNSASAVAAQVTLALGGPGSQKGKVSYEFSDKDAVSEGFLELNRLNRVRG
ncbi:MAG: glutamate racemase [Bdellovibrionales bacterium]|nr:glutamate racemase [Bdellovibrionales bacterium]